MGQTVRQQPWGLIHMVGQTVRQEKGRGRCKLRSARWIKYHIPIIKEIWREGKMDDRKYYYLWLLFKKETANKAMSAISTEVQDHYNQVLQDMAVLEADMMMEV